MFPPGFDAFFEKFNRVNFSWFFIYNVTIFIKVFTYKLCHLLCWNSSREEPWENVSKDRPGLQVFLRWKCLWYFKDIIGFLPFPVIIGKIFRFGKCTKWPKCSKICFPSSFFIISWKDQIINQNINFFHFLWNFQQFSWLTIISIKNLHLIMVSYLKNTLNDGFIKEWSW